MNHKNNGHQGSRQTQRHPGAPSGKKKPGNSNGSYRSKNDRNGKPSGRSPHRNQGPRRNTNLNLRRQLDPFEVFRIYHLGLVSDTQFRRMSLVDAARVFQVHPNELKQYMVRQGIDLDTIHKTDFDLDLARLDIKVAPEGIDKTEVARQLYLEFVDMRGPWEIVEDSPPAEAEVTPDTKNTAPHEASGPTTGKANSAEAWTAPSPMAKSNRS